ncbi:MAG: four helix bundle protein [Saprospiraceae bacterium]
MSLDFTYNFEKLDVWQSARKLVANVYTITRKFPVDERFGIVSQLRRSAISIASNIAEGTTRKSLKDMARFTQISYGSTIELYNQLYMSLDLKLLSEADFQILKPQIQEITNKLNSLYNYQISKSQVA